jgi:acetate kinase
MNTSLRSCLKSAPEIAKGRVIVAHLGSGASLCALRDGKSVDTTMGFTAVDGLCMGHPARRRRSGSHSFTSFQNRGLTVKEVETVLYKKSGLLAISGIS